MDCYPLFFTMIHFETECKIQVLIANTGNSG